MLLKTKAKKKALITGVFGQDGSYLAELLIKKGYQVTGTYYPNRPRPEYAQSFADKLELKPLDISQTNKLNQVLSADYYDEIYNLAAITFIPKADRTPVMVKEINTDAVVNILEFLSKNKLSSRFFQPASAHIFDFHQPMPLSLKSKINPDKPYAISKASSFFWTRFYRQTYNLYAVNAVLFNHESERRPKDFVIMKIIHQAVEIKYGLRQRIKLGNLDIARDWGYAPDYVEAIWLSLQQNNPEDVLIATGKSHDLKSVLDLVFDFLELGKWAEYVEVDSGLIRHDDVKVVFGDPKETAKRLSWRPVTEFKTMIGKIIKFKLAELKP